MENSSLVLNLAEKTWINLGVFIIPFIWVGLENGWKTYLGIEASILNLKTLFIANFMLNCQVLVQINIFQWL